MSKKEYPGERGVFIALLLGMMLAGYAYQANKGAVSQAILLPAIIGFLIFLGAMYYIIVRFWIKR